MGKTLEDAGMLVKDENGELKVSEPTARKFLKVRNNLLDSGDTGLPFPCITVDEKSRQTTLRIFWEDKEKYPAFFKKWIDGILLNELKNLNVDGNIMLPIYDPIAMGAKLEVENMPNLPLPALFGALAMPPGTPLPLLMINMKFKDALKAMEKIPGILKPPIPPIPQLPVPVDIEFPTLEFSPVEFSLLGKHIGLNLAMPNMVKTLFDKISNIDFLPSLTPTGLFELSCSVVNESNPPPPASNDQTDMGSYNVNFAAISAIKAEALAISTLGSIIGSAPTGITGNLGAEGGHKDPPPPQEEPGPSNQLESPTIDFFPPLGEEEATPGEEKENNATSGLWTPTVPSKECNRSDLQDKITGKNQCIAVWNQIMIALNNYNAQPGSGAASSPSAVFYTGNPKPFTILHAQIVQGIVGSESGNGSKPAAGTNNNWAGIECSEADKKNSKVKCGTGNLYREYNAPSESIKEALGLLARFGSSHKIKTNAISVPCYLMKNGPADRDEPSKYDINDDRATFYRVYYSLRRMAMYYETYSTVKSPSTWYSYVNSDTYKKYNGKVDGWHKTPELSPGGAELFAECVRKYAEASLLHIQAALYHNNVKWAMPKGTYEDAHIWWVSKFRPMKKYQQSSNGQITGDWNDEFVLNKPKPPPSSLL